MTYFSERELGERPRNQEELTAIVWAGITSEISARIRDGSFGASYPEVCPDEGIEPIGGDERDFANAMHAQIPSLPRQAYYGYGDIPPLLDVMDMVEFCWQCIGKPARTHYHSGFKHHHLVFDVEQGRTEFRDTINRIFRRNGLAFDLDEDGKVQRLAPPALRKALQAASFRTGDALLDRTLEEAREKFLSPDESRRREALEKLWDGFERIKTLEPGADKRAQAGLLLDKAATGTGPKFREALEVEAKALTEIGNSFHIRHSETTQEPLSSSLEVDYLFHRLFSFLSLVLRGTHRM